MYHIYMKYKNILLTGGRGFIGFNALMLWKKLYPECNLIALDANTYADKDQQSFKNQYLENNDIKYYELDLSEKTSYNELLHIIDNNNIDAIIHMAAESHVDNSILNPNIFFQSNIIGTVNVLNVVRKTNIRLHVVSTDEIYGETTPNDWLLLDDNELPQINPSSPYSSSKASADLIAKSYFRTFGTKVSISRCSNNFGPFQHPEKLIPTVINKVLKNEKIPVYGKRNQKRHWIYVDEHNKSIMNILEKGQPGFTYNIAPLHDNYLANIDLIKFIIDKLGKSYDLIEHVQDRAGHDVSYYMEANYDFCNSNRHWQDDMIKTIEFYRNFKGSYEK